MGEQKTQKKKNWWYYTKYFLIALSSLIGIICLIVASYVIYVVCQYYRIDDNLSLQILNNTKYNIKLNKELTFTTMNVGFGAYSPDFTFFMDTGYDENGNVTQGVGSRAKNKQTVVYNTENIINDIQTLNSDFIAFQEVDVSSDRSYHVDQKQMIIDNFNDYGNVFTYNFHSAYLMYPIFNPHGKSNSGLLTLSKYNIETSIRKSYIVDESFPNKFFDLDRCFIVNYIPVENDKQLVLINSHMSAYDEGGVIRNKQLDQLYSFMLSEYQKGNYVICGGDFNHDLLTNNPLYDEFSNGNIPFQSIIKQKKPDWLSYMFDENKKSIFDNEFDIYAASNCPSLRDTDVEYIENYTYVSTVDGFIASKNVEFISVENLIMDDENANMFAFSDHQASTLKFKLN